MELIFFITFIYLGLVSDYMVLTDGSRFNLHPVNWLAQLKPKQQRVLIIIFWSMVNTLCFVMGYGLASYLPSNGHSSMMFLGSGLLLAIALRIFHEANGKTIYFSTHQRWDLPKIGAYSTAMGIHFLAVGLALQTFQINIKFLLILFITLTFIYLIGCAFLPMHCTTNQLKMVKKSTAVLVLIGSVFLIISNAKNLM